MAKKRVPARTPTEETKKILDVVRLLPRNAVLRQPIRVFAKKIIEDTEGRLRALSEQYEISLDEGHALSVSFIDDDVQPTWRAKAEKLSSKERRKFAWYEVLASLQLEAFRECLDGLPDGFVAYIDLPSNDDEAFYLSFARLFPTATLKDFSAVEADRGLLPYLRAVFEHGSIAKYTEARDWYIRIYEMMDYIKKMKEQRAQRKTATYSQLDFYGREDVTIVDNRLIFSPDEFTLTFNNVDISRLRICDNDKCAKVFWVRRLQGKNSTGKLGCTKACNGILRTRRWREKTTEEQRLRYKINRYKKSIKTIEGNQEDKDGTL